ncbi:MAG: ferritin-like domain-containing protein [Candidatus Omnitrophota bacterium]|nr:MAG: ferritin-like domain-containing protein [Candidatus Omnitrophota bacterium]
MGTKGKEIVNLKTEEVVRLLNKAYADEWFAYYQYWVGAKVVKGPMRPAVVQELEEHAADELKHATKIVDRIIQLGGRPLLKPADWASQANCPYIAPSNEHVVKVLEQNIKGEQCAIEVYNKLLQYLEGKDTLTYHMVLEILEDEVEHEEDLETILEDIKLCK